MHKTITFLAFSLLSLVAQAQNAPVYYKGTEALPFASPMDCFVEAVYSADLSSVQLRALIPHPHEAGHPVEAIGPFEATYNSAGYYRFQSTEAAPQVKDVLLTAATPGVATKYGALLLHGSHNDPLFCESLTALEGDAQQEAIDAFAGFTPEEEHEHDHDHEDHDHDHDHE